MKRKIKIILFLFVVFLLVNTITTTYAKYVTASTGDITTDFAKWQISINNTNVTQNYNTSVTYTPVLESNSNVNSGKMAPGSTGYFDIQIDPSNTDVSFTYTINVVANSNNTVDDLKITHYAIFNTNDLNPTITKISTNGSNITGNKIYNNTTLTPFTVRIFYGWIEGTGETMDDDEDTAIGIAAANNETITSEYTINVGFSQYIGS